MIVNLKEFMREWEWATRFAEKKSTIPILKHVAIQSDGHRVALAGTDLELFGMTSVGCIAEAGEPDIAITAPAASVLDYLKLLKGDTAQIRMAGDSLVIEQDGRGGKFLCMPIDGYPTPPRAPAPRYELSGINVSFPRCLTSVSAEESRFTLNGALIRSTGEGDAMGLEMAATDGHRMTLHKLACATPVTEPFHAIIHRSAIFEASRINGGHVAFGCDKDPESDTLLQVFYSGQRTLIARGLSGGFPDVDRVVPKSLPNSVTFDAAEFKAALERVDCFTGKRSRCFRISIDQSASLWAEQVDMGQGRETIALPAGIEKPYECGFNAGFWLDFLGKVSGPITFSFSDPKCAALLESADGFKYVVMPMRM